MKLCFVRGAYFEDAKRIQLLYRQALGRGHMPWEDYRVFCEYIPGINKLVAQVNTNGWSCAKLVHFFREDPDTILPALEAALYYGRSLVEDEYRKDIRIVRIRAWHSMKSAVRAIHPF